MKYVLTKLYHPYTKCSHHEAYSQNRPDCIHGPLPAPFLLSYSVLIIIFSLFFVSGPCARLSWPSRQLLSQGWERNVKPRDRDKTETLTSRDRDETETLASPAETRPRRDVKISRQDRDVTLVSRREITVVMLQ